MPKPTAAPKPFKPFGPKKNATRAPAQVRPPKTDGLGGAGGEKPPAAKPVGTGMIGAPKKAPGASTPLDVRVVASAAKAPGVEEHWSVGQCASWCTPGDCVLGGCVACSYCASPAAASKLPSAASSGGAAALPVLTAPKRAKPAARPTSSTGAWIGVGVGAVVVVLLALALAVICKPPLAQKLPSPLARLFEPLARLGGGKQYAPVGARTADADDYDTFGGSPSKADDAGAVSSPKSAGAPARTAADAEEGQHM